MRMSQARASSMPPPITQPLSAAMIGLGVLCNPRVIRPANPLSSDDRLSMPRQDRTGQRHPDHRLPSGAGQPGALARSAGGGEGDHFVEALTEASRERLGVGDGFGVEVD